MTSLRQQAGFTIVELVVVLLILAFLLVVAVPSIGGARNASGVQQSISNLTTMSLAHVLYAADWEGRQVTWVRDDLGAYWGDPVSYNEAHDCPNYWDPICQPPIVAGIGPTQIDIWTTWAYWPTHSNRAMYHFRIPNLRPFHDYLSGRFQDWVYYAPKDAIILDDIEHCIDQPPEFVAYPEECNPAWSSYCLSPAAMFHPDVMRSNAAGGWQAPWELDHGYESPGLFQAAYPDLKTHMLEHSWLQNNPGLCNESFTGCEPYYFNHSIDSAPATLFYDGSVRLLPNTEVLAADQQVFDQTNGVDGLWHRGTLFGDNGYLIDVGYDLVPLSHHILTTDGILGRDSLNGASPMPRAAPAEPRRGARNRRATAWRPKILPASAIPFTPEDEL
jgi:prepilin-type N-terminal cleavage/methylation domain-containing protein